MDFLHDQLATGRFLNEAITSWVLLAGAAIVVSVALIVRAGARGRRRLLTTSRR